MTRVFLTIKIETRRVNLYHTTPAREYNDSRSFGGCKIFVCFHYYITGQQPLLCICSLMLSY